MFPTPLPVAKVMFAVMAILFTMSLADLHPVLVFYSVLGLAFAGYLLAAANERTRHGR